MAKQVIIPAHPPKWHYSKGTKTEHFIFTAGVLGHTNPETGESIKGIEAQTRQCLDDIKEIVESGGASMNDVMTITFYVRNPDDFPVINEICKEYFPKDPPARATIIASLLFPEMLVEVQAIACCPAK